MGERSISTGILRLKLKKIETTGHFCLVVSKGELKMNQIFDVVIVGSGIAGIFAGIALSQSNLNVVILDKGKSVSKRKCLWDCKQHSAVCDVSCGEGGAGLFSDGCLHYSTQIGGGSVNPTFFEHYRKIIDRIYEDSGLSQYIGYPDREFLQELRGLNLKYSDIEQRVFGEDKVILLVEYLKSLWNKNTTSKMNTRVDHISKTKLGFKIFTKNDTYESRFVIIATGQWDHKLTKQTCETLGISVSEVPTSYGFRIETLYDRLKDVTQRYYNWKIYGNKFRTFCVNNRGRVLMHRGEEGRLSTNGSHSNSEPTANTNLAIMSYIQSDKMLSIMRSRKVNEPPILQRWQDLIEKKVTASESLEKNKVKPTLKQFILGNFWDVFEERIIKDFIIDMYRFNQFSPNMIHDDLLITGPEWKYFYLNYPQTERYESKQVSNIFFVGDTNSICYALVMSSLSGYVAGEEIYKKVQRNEG